ncbi:MAG: glycerol-3-phosphate dehydrogenase/oxidase [Thermodesulfobacteriota bacterium]
MDLEIPETRCTMRAIITQREDQMNLKNIDQHWDLIVIGGGITGAGVLREAGRMGLKTLLVEQKDFAWGTSSRSAKLVHGGLRYLKEGKLRLTHESVVGRERLLREAPGLVEPLEFLMPMYAGRGPGKWAMRIGLTVYDLMAGKKRHSYRSAEQVTALAPGIKQDGLTGGFRFVDAQVDDARLVLRLIRESIRSGACALNYTSVVQVMRDTRGRVVGAILEDAETHETRELSARAVINATGAWAERLHPSPEPGKHLRPLRGSHLVFPASVLPVDRAIALSHPADRRPVYVLPWEGAVLFGTTDVDHREDISYEPAITPEEAAYLMHALEVFFPSLRISLADCLSTFAGIRAVLSEGKRAPSQESREHVVWVDNGLVTVTGGKLTTFYRLAWDALAAAKPFLTAAAVKPPKGPLFTPAPETIPGSEGLPREIKSRLFGRYGTDALELLKMARLEDLEAIPGTHTLWAELPFAAKFEQVRHLSDLLLRRVRIGLLTPHGATGYLERIRALCEPALPWVTTRWEQESKDYQEHWDKAYGVPRGAAR